MLIEKVVYRAQVQAAGGRDIRAVSSDGALNVKLSTPRELGGANRPGTNPEQLFAASYAASFLATLRLVAAENGIAPPGDMTVEATVGIGPMRQGFAIEVELRISLPGLPRAEADCVVERAHATCPYSSATRGNISVRLVIA
jgi:lipoyl-dependent peroxiredoxin